MTDSTDRMKAMGRDIAAAVQLRESLEGIKAAAPLAPHEDDGYRERMRHQRWDAVNNWLTMVYGDKVIKPLTVMWVSEEMKTVMPEILSRIAERHLAELQALEARLAEPLAAYLDALEQQAGQ